MSNSVTLKVDEVMKSFHLSYKVFVKEYLYILKEYTLDDFKWSGDFLNYLWIACKKYVQIYPVESLLFL